MNISDTGKDLMTGAHRMTMGQEVRPAAGVLKAKAIDNELGATDPFELLDLRCHCSGRASPAFRRPSTIAEYPAGHVSATVLCSQLHRGSSSERVRFHAVTSTSTSSAWWLPWEPWLMSSVMESAAAPRTCQWQQTIMKPATIPAVSAAVSDRSSGSCGAVNANFEVVQHGVRLRRCFQ